MAVNNKMSLTQSVIWIVVLFSGMQMYKVWLSSSHLGIIFGGYLGSMLFICTLTAIRHAETLLFGKSSQQSPDVIFSLMVSLIATALIHRVTASTCLILCTINLHFINRDPQEIYNMLVQNPITVQLKKRK